MINFVTPYWLLSLLLVIPLIYWLHRFMLLPATVQTTTLFLWQNMSQLQKSSGGKSARPDILWLLRALIATLLILALARPYLQGSANTLEVWLDDSLSMFTREQQQLRIQSAMQQLQIHLGEHHYSSIYVHSLSQPSRVLVLDDSNVSGWKTTLTEWTSMPRGEPLPPPHQSLSPDSSHILITDAADSTLNHWAESAPLTTVLLAGKKSQNTLLSSLSLRQSLTDDSDIKGLVRIDNSSDQPQTVRLVIERQKTILQTVMLNIPATDHVLTDFSIQHAAQGSIQARLESENDPLLLDNSLKLELKQLRQGISFELHGNCDAPLLAALRAHPSLIQSEHNPELLINCSGKEPVSERPVLNFHPVSDTLRSTQPAHWHLQTEIDSLPLTDGLRYSSSAPQLSSSHITLLSVHGRSLILQRAVNPNILDYYLDNSDPLLSQQPQYPLLLYLLVSRVTGHSLAIEPLMISRDIQASRIKPLPLSIDRVSQSAQKSLRIFYDTQCLLAAFLLLLLDIALALKKINVAGKAI